jgi:hypothetical protein
MTTIPKTDLSSELVAKGEVELGIVPITQHSPLRVLSLRTSAARDSVLFNVRWCNQSELEVPRRFTGFA